MSPGKSQIKPDLYPEPVQPPRDPKVRTLKEPPDIWDLVHESRAEFKPGSAFVAHLTAIHPMVLVVILLIIGGAAFWFLTLRGKPDTHIAAPSAPAENSTPSVLSSPLPESNTTASPPAVAQQSDSTPALSNTAGSTFDPPSTEVAAPALSSEKTVSAEPRRPNITSSTKATGETVATKRNKNGARPSIPTAARTAAPLTVNKDDSQRGTLPPKSEKEKASDAAAVNKAADKPLSPQLIAPAKAGPTPKAKVIPWP